MHHSTPARARRPSDAMRVKALRSRMRQIKRTDGADPWHGGPSTLPGRRGCSCGYGSRASWHDVGCSVGRCASRNPSSSHIQWRFSRSQVSATCATQIGHSSHEETRLRVTRRIRVTRLARFWGYATPASVRPSRPNATCPHRVDKRVDKARPKGRRCW